jgi:hypothetical protein
VSATLGPIYVSKHRPLESAYKFIDRLSSLSTAVSLEYIYICPFVPSTRKLSSRCLSFVLYIVRGGHFSETSTQIGTESCYVRSFRLKGLECARVCPHSRHEKVNRAEYVALVQPSNQQETHSLPYTSIIDSSHSMT